MATIRLPEQIWGKAYHHLFDAPGEHFAFFLANWTYSEGKPIFLVQDLILVSDNKVSMGWEGFSIGLETLLSVINTAIKKNFCIVEAHNHGGEKPRFSTYDREELQEFVPYVLDSLRGKPYAATVWGDSAVFGRYYLPDGSSGEINSITVTGNRLMQIASTDNDSVDISLFDRQLPWFSSEGQRQLASFRIGVIGCGGIGAQTIQNLVYLGSRDSVLIDDDLVEDTDLNRLVTATPADIGTPKVFVARRMIRSIAKESKVQALNKSLRSEQALDVLKGVDIIFGCVDNDGARLILNELALAYNIPYIDIAVGINTTDDNVSEIGGRVALVIPDGPCLYCMGEIDPVEAGYFLATPEQQRFQVERGYVSGMNIKAPAVVSLNALVAAAAVNEFAVYVSGLRPINTLTAYDLLGSGRKIKSQWLTPINLKQNPSCIECAYKGLLDNANLERYF